MGYNRQKMLDIAAAELKYLEKASNAQLDDKSANAGNKNYTKYARDLDALGFFNGRKQGFAWCAVWVCWLFVQAFGVDAAKKLLCLPSKAASNCAAGCKYLRNYFKNKGQLFDMPEVGDVVFFYSSNRTQIAHTGVVYKVDKTYVYTEEGNTSSSSGVVSEGGGVFRKKYKLNYSRLAGYGRPLYNDGYGEAKNTETEQTYTLYTVKKGDNLWNIAKKHLGKGNRYPEIKSLNGLTSDMIHTGQKLKLPKA